MKTKKELRKEILQLRDALTLEERQIKSHQIAEQVINLKEFIEADKVLLFASYKSEVDTFELFDAARSLSKDIYYPKVIGEEMKFYQVKEKEDLLEGYRGIREPKAEPERKFVPKPEDKIFVLMPGAVFDEEGNRIGYGGGFYDRFLQRLAIAGESEKGICNQLICRAAIAFECQVVDVGQIISKEHDIKPDCIVTENELIKIKTPANTNGKIQQQEEQHEIIMESNNPVTRA